MTETYENHLKASVEVVMYDTDTPEELGRFYAKFLGGTLECDPERGCAVIVPGMPFVMVFQYDEDYTRPVWPGTKGDQLQMVHIDVKVEDMKKAQEFLLSNGATMPEVQFCQPEWETQWITMLDPSGHPFCIWEGELE